MSIGHLSTSDYTSWDFERIVNKELKGISVTLSITKGKCIKESKTMFCIFDVKLLKQCSIYTIFLEKEVEDKISVHTNIYTTILTSQCQDGQTINNLIRKGISSFHLWIMHVWQGASMSCYSWSRSASS